MKRHSGLLGFFSTLLVLALLLAATPLLTGAGFEAPENPIAARNTVLAAEALDGPGAHEGAQTEQPEEPTQETPAQEEPPEETQPPTEPEPEPEPESTLPEESTEPSEQTPQPGQDENNGDGEPGSDIGNGDATDEDDNGLAGDGDGGSTADDVKIVTDLRSCQLTRLDLPDGVLNFYAYPSVDDARFSVRVVMNNSTTAANGTPLESADGRHYSLSLPLNETTTVTLYLRQDGENLSYVRYRIRFEAEKADEETPEIGDFPPSIVTNLDGFTGRMETQDFLFWVSARTQPDGAPIYSDQIEVWLNGTLIPKQTGDARPEYELHFDVPNVGDEAQYTVKVRAWDGRGNSTMKVYTFLYHTVSEGDSLGQVRLVLDATTVGLGIIDSAAYDIVQGDTAAGVVLRFLEDYGYSAVYDGSATVGFYLRRISRGGMCAAAAVPERLWSMILRDGIQLSGTSFYDSLGEYDYTMGSGWMYSINGSIYPGRGLSDYKLSSDTTIYLRFTLTYGKDIGGYDATGQGYGSLSGYCGIWAGGGYTPLEHQYVETERLEPTQTVDGYIRYVCERCGESSEELLPKTGENPSEPEPTEPEPTGPEPTAPEPTDPEPTEPEPAEPEPPVTGDTEGSFHEAFYYICSFAEPLLFRFACTGCGAGAA